MQRLLLASLPWILACASRAPAPTNRTPTSVAYALVPLSLSGGEGRHSASHSDTHVSGTLALDGPKATLELAFETFVGHVRCPKEMRDGTVTTMQQCASDDAKDGRSSSTLVLRGETRVDNGAMVASLRAGERAMKLTCTSSFVGLYCAVSDLERLFGIPGDSPSAMSFAAAGAKKLDLAPLYVRDVGHVAGGIEIRGATASVALSVDGGVPTILPGTVQSLIRERGFLIRAQTSPTRTFVARCTPDDGDGLACEVTADRSVLGKPEHVNTQMIAVPRRD
jgi:hypothetical protein